MTTISPLSDHTPTSWRPPRVYGGLALVLPLLLLGPAHRVEAQHPESSTPAPAAASAEQQPAPGGADPRDAASGDDLGTVDFDVSCDPAVEEEFDRALALLHHMMYEQSRAAFEAVAQRDPECAMAHWGIAMTLFQPLWPTRPGPEELARGRAETERARSLDPGSAREHALVDAAAAFFREPDAAWWTRVERWAEAMERAHAEHSADPDVTALRALALLAAGQVAEDRMAQHERAAELLLDVHQRSPLHPGAIHYLIHANDAAGRAGGSLDVVRSYDEIAPTVPHALHMPTHIFVRLGAWPEVIEWNRRSAEAALRSPAGDAVSHHYAHAMDYLLYARLQRGEDEQAAQILAETLAAGPYQDSFISAFHLAVMPARFAVERRDWERAARIEPRTPATLSWDRYPWAEAQSWLARGLGAVHTGDLASADRAAQRLSELEEKARAAGEEGFATYIAIDRSILGGLLAEARGESDRAVELLRHAAELEGTIEKHPVTPGALLPPREALGDLLLELDRPPEALAAYRESLEVWPARYRSLLGAARAARHAGDEEAAVAGYRRLLEVAGASADVAARAADGAQTSAENRALRPTTGTARPRLEAERPGLEEARGYVDRHQRRS